jgi:hypothetical protein
MDVENQPTHSMRNQGLEPSLLMATGTIAILLIRVEVHIPIETACQPSVIKKKNVKMG